MTMTLTLFLEQILNGVQFGVFLFLISAGLTLVLGIMNVVNLAHGSLYMLGAYVSTTLYTLTGNLFIAFVLMVPILLIIGMIVEIVVLRTMYERDHMDQVLATFGLILFFNELVRILWGVEGVGMKIPDSLAGSIDIGVPYPSYRLLIIAMGILVSVALYLMITKTRTGMQIRAGASNRPMIGALGINIRILYTIVFGLGAVFAGFAGLMAGPIISIESGMGEEMLIFAFVVIVIGGIGSIRGALVASVVVGVFEIVGRSILPYILLQLVTPDQAQTAGPALASMLVYILMVVILFFKPQGLFPARTG
jgi:branched-chain amino acid transport system permease protein